MQPTRIKTSAGMETVDETVNRVKSAINTVPVDTLENPPAALELPQVEFDPTTARSAVEAAQGFSQQQEANLQQQQEAEKTQTGAVRNLMDFVAGKGAERVQSLEQAGVPESQKDLADLSTDIRLSTANLSTFDDYTLLGEEELRQEGAGRDITKNTFSAQANQRRLQRAVERTGRAAALRTQIATAELMQNNITAATAQIDAALEAKYGPVEQALQNEMFFLQRQFQVSDRADSRAFEARMGVVQAQQTAIQDAKDMVINAMPYATPSELQAMNDPSLTPEEQFKMAQSVTGRGLRQEKQAEMYSRSLQNTLNQMKIDGMNAPSYGEVANTALQDSPDSGTIRDVLTGLMRQDDIPASVRTSVGTVFDVATQLESLALANPEGKFAGLGAGGGISGWAATPFVAMLASDDYKEERSSNRSSVEAINLKVQQWASGAALTEEQTKQVAKITPKAGDTDGEIRRKTNALYNTMLDITESQLVTAGYNIRFPSVDMFELGDLIEQMSPEQKRMMEDAVTSNTSTSAYGT